MIKKMFTLPASAVISAVNCDGPCAKYAVTELQRLLKKLGTKSTVAEVKVPRSPSAIFIGTTEMRAGRITTGRIRHDGFKLVISPGMTILTAISEKGLLNAVYSVAEKLGFTFLLPTEANELLSPEAPFPLPICEVIFNPRTPFRGVFASIKGTDYPMEEWMKFYAKLRFNAVCAHGGAAIDDPKFGFRFESGGHGLSSLVPRELFAKKPELFRMFQPEDFHGQRLNDANFCTGSAEAWAVAEKNLVARKPELNRLYAAHLWADDLPAGGWCMCPMCRSYAPADQNLFAMRTLAELARKNGITAKIPAIAYHDTMFPSKRFSPDPDGNYLLFAPRERCYGHALHDPKCRLNKHYMKSLKDNRIAFRACSDAHTFEYYCDQILFRGMYPFLPNVVIADYLCYSRHGIETHMTLQVGGSAAQPDYNMLLFAAAGWNRDLWADTFTEELTTRFAGKNDGAPFRAYLDARGEIFEEAMKWCGADPDAAHLDYRWLPEEHTEFRKDRVRAYASSAKKLAAAAAKLATAAETLPAKLKKLALAEVKRAEFESSSLQIMSLQQDALCHFAEGRANNNRRMIARGITLMQELLKQLPESVKKATAAGIGKGYYYEAFAGKWLTDEFKRKIKSYEKLISQ